MSPRVIAAAKAHVPVMMRSGIVACVVGFNSSTPVMVIVGEPKP